MDEARYTEARELLRDCLSADPGCATLHELLCECLRREGDPGAALAACRKATELAPERASAWLETGRTLNNLGRLPAAREALTKARDLAPDNAEIQHDLAHVCRRLGDTAAARAGFETATQLQPDWAAAWYRLGSLELAADGFRQAEKCLRRAVQLDPSNAAILTTLGVALHRLGRLDEAMDHYRIALQRDATCTDAWGNLGIALQEQGEIDEAVAAYRRALALRPDDFQAGAHLGDALLEVGQPDEALLVSSKLLRSFPGHSGALATRSIGLMRTGQADGYRELVDFERLILAVDIAVPEGFADLEDFNKRLTQHVEQHPSLRYQPTGHATRFGHHTGNLLRDDKGPVAALESAVGDAARAYENLLPGLGAHPLAASRPRAWQLSLWSVVMRNQGHQLPHIHPSAWLSGVYYARVPRSITVTDDKQSGWIEFGRPPAELAGGLDFPVRRFMPREGLMILFPAYFYHQTIPLESDELRVSLAFDLAPARPGGANMRQARSSI